MTPQALLDLAETVKLRRVDLNHTLSEIKFAPSDAPTDDPAMDITMEALFLRVFTEYEADLERLFLHYVTGGASISARHARSYLAARDETHARRMVVNGFRFLSWAKPSAVRETAKNYLENGWPITDVLASKTQDITDCEKIRNRIAHRSVEAAADFAAVQRNLFQTERVFPITPGHVLRTRFRGKSQHVLRHYNDELATALIAITDPPP